MLPCSRRPLGGPAGQTQRTLVLVGAHSTHQPGGTAVAQHSPLWTSNLNLPVVSAGPRPLILQQGVKDLLDAAKPQDNRGTLGTQVRQSGDTLVQNKVTGQWLSGQNTLA